MIRIEAGSPCTVLPVGQWGDDRYSFKLVVGLGCEVYVGLVPLHMSIVFMCC